MKSVQIEQPTDEGEPTTPEVARAINVLMGALRAEYGDEFTVRVTARGDVLAARGGVYGFVRPRSGPHRVNGGKKRG